jgi:hypothetical protein
MLGGLWGIITGAALLALAGALIWRARRQLSEERLRVLLFLGCGFYLALIPIVSLSVSELDSDCERFLYFPSAFTVIATVALLQWLTRSRVVFRSALFALALFYVAALNYSNTAWREAGALTAQVLGELRALPRDKPIILLNLPDTLRGAFVCRFGCDAGLRLYDPDNPLGSALVVLTRHTVLDKSDRVDVIKSPDSLTLSLADKRAYYFDLLTREVPSLLDKPVTVRRRSQTVITLDWPTSKVPFSLYYYSAGALRLLPQ